MRRISIEAAATMLLLLTLGSADALAAPNGSISVSPSTIAPGGTIHVSGSVDPSTCTASQAVTLTGVSDLFPPDGFGPSTQRDAQGDFSVDYTVPTSTPAGRYEIGLRCGGGNVGVSATLTVAGTPIGGAATGAGGATGRFPWRLVGIGCLTLAGAIGSVRRARARRPV